MYFYCDVCNKKLGEYLHGPGGVEKKGNIRYKPVGWRRKINGDERVHFVHAGILPDIICFVCYKVGQLSGLQRGKVMSAHKTFANL